MGYVQYMNDGNNNFSLIRNAEINRIGPNYIKPIYYDVLNVDNEMKKQNAHEDEKYAYEHKDRFETNKTHFINKYKFNADGVPDVDIVDVSKNDETQKDVFTINF